MFLSLTRGSLLLAALLAVGSICPARAQQPATQTTDHLFEQFNGVRLGMNAGEIHKLIGKPDDMDTVQEMFSLSDSRRIRVYYDGDGNARAIISTFIGEKSGAPTPETVLGSAAEPAADGSVSASISRPEEGYSVYYSRIVGDPPLVMITIQKL